MPPRFRYRTFCILLSLALVAGCKFKVGGDDTAEANKRLDEAKEGIAAANQMSQEAYTKFTSYMSPEALDDFPSNRERIKATAQESADLFGKSAATFRDRVVSKLDGASKLDINEKFREYITHKAEAFRKLAESKEVGKELALTPLDPSLTTLNALVAKAREVDARLNALVKQHDEANARADKVQRENPNVILTNPPQ